MTLETLLLETPTRFLFISVAPSGWRLLIIPFEVVLSDNKVIHSSVLWENRLKRPSSGCDTR